MSVRLALVDDHRMFREVFRTFVCGQGEFEVVGEAGGGAEANALLHSVRADVVVMEVALRGGDGIMTTRELVRREPRACVLMLSMHEDEHTVARALAAGARGYACKAETGEAVLGAIRAVARGGTYLPPHVNRQVIEGLSHTLARARQPGVLALLSERERDVFRLLVRGVNNDGIASMLHIAQSTVETHRARIIKRLRVHTLAGLVRFAAEHQLLHA